jgi:hypothetical protein
VAASREKVAGTGSRPGFGSVTRGTVLEPGGLRRVRNWGQGRRRARFKSFRGPAVRPCLAISSPNRSCRRVPALSGARITASCCVPLALVHCGVQEVRILPELRVPCTCPPFGRRPPQGPGPGEACSCICTKGVGVADKEPGCRGKDGTALPDPDATGRGNRAGRPGRGTRFACARVANAPRPGGGQRVELVRRAARPPGPRPPRQKHPGSEPLPRA